MSVEKSVEAASPAPRSVAGEADLQTYWRVLMSRKWVMLGVILAFVVGTAFYTLRQPKIYDATCSIIIDIAAPKFLDEKQVAQVADVGSGGYWASREYFETELRVLSSQSTALRVVDMLRLQPSPASGGDPTSQRESTARSALASVRLEPVRDSRVVRIISENPDPEKAALLANGFADAYIAQTISRRAQTTENASQWLTEQLADLTQKMKESGDKLFAFKQSHDILSTSWEDRQNIVSQRLVSINEALTKTRIHLAELDGKAEAMRELSDAFGKGKDEQAVALADVLPGMENQLASYRSTQTECAVLLLRYETEHPKVKDCNERLSSMRAGIRDAAMAVRTNAERELREVRKTQENLVKLLEQTKQESFSFNRFERDYSDLKRSYDSTARLYDLLLNRSKDANLTGMLQMSNVRILDRARPGLAPVKPNLKKNFGVALFLGLIAAIVVALALEYLDTSISTQDQIEEQLGLSMLGVVPEIDTKGGSAPELVVHAQPKSAVSECLRVIRTNILFMSPERPLRTILVTSSGPGEGKTTASAALAQAMAESGSRVLLVDADMRRPRLHKVFGMSNAAGLSSLILDESTFDAACQVTSVPNLTVLPCGPVPPNPVELLHTEGFGRLLARMVQAYDRVVFDSPPVGVVSDALVLSTLVDGTVLVLKAGSTSRDLARRVVRALAGVKARLFGAILNEIDVTQSRYGYTYFQYGYNYNQSEKERSEPT